MGVGGDRGSQSVGDIEMYGYLLQLVLPAACQPNTGSFLQGQSHEIGQDQFNKIKKMYGH